MSGLIPGEEPKPTPPGLEVLESTTHLFIKQCVEVTEALTGFETKNKYEIVNSKNERIFFAVETTNYCLVCCSRTSRPFKFKVLDHIGRVVMKIKRPCSCTSPCGCRLCCCGLFNCSKVNVSLPNDGGLLGQVEESCTIFTPEFVVKDGDLKKKLKIVGPSCAFCCSCKMAGQVEFEVHSLEGSQEQEQCGRISKEFEGFERTAHKSDADNYGISFPLDMEPRMKATLLGAVLLIDFEYFEDDSSGKKGAGGGGRGAKYAAVE